MLTPTLLAQTTASSPAAAPSITLFVELDKAIQSGIDAFVGKMAANLTSDLQPLALVGATLYLLYLGYTILYGADATPFYTVLKKCFKIAFVAAFSLSASGYLGGFVAVLKGLETGLIQSLPSFGEFDVKPPDNLAKFLDDSMSLGFDKAALCFQFGISKVWSPGAAFGWILLGLVFGFATAALVMFGGAIVLLAKFSLMILFALGPLFVFALMFPQTENFFYRWVGEALSFIFQNVIVAIVLAFALAEFKNFAGRAVLDGSDEILNPLKACLQILVLSCVMVFLLVKSGPMGAALSGGASASFMGSTSAAGASRSILGKVGGFFSGKSSGSSSSDGGSTTSSGEGRRENSPSWGRRLANWIGGSSKGWSASKGERSTSSLLDRLASKSQSDSSPRATQRAVSQPTQAKASSSVPSSAPIPKGEAPKMALLAHQVKAMARYGQSNSAPRYGQARNGPSSSGSRSGPSNAGARDERSHARARDESSGSGSREGRSNSRSRPEPSYGRARSEEQYRQPPPNPKKWK